MGWGVGSGLWGLGGGGGARGRREGRTAGGWCVWTSPSRDAHVEGWRAGTVAVEGTGRCSLGRPARAPRRRSRETPARRYRPRARRVLAPCGRGESRARWDGPAAATGKDGRPPRGTGTGDRQPRPQALTLLISGVNACTYTRTHARTHARRHVDTHLRTIAHLPQAPAARRQSRSRQAMPLGGPRPAAWSGTQRRTRKWAGERVGREGAGLWRIAGEELGEGQGGGGRNGGRSIWG